MRSYLYGFCADNPALVLGWVLASPGSDVSVEAFVDAEGRIVELGTSPGMRRSPVISFWAGLCP